MAKKTENEEKMLDKLKCYITPLLVTMIIILGLFVSIIVILFLAGYRLMPTKDAVIDLDIVDTLGRIITSIGTIVIPFFTVYLKQAVDRTTEQNKLNNIQTASYIKLILPDHINEPTKLKQIIKSYIAMRGYVTAEDIYKQHLDVKQEEIELILHELESEKLIKKVAGESLDKNIWQNLSK